MPDTKFKPADEADYILCEKCSEDPKVGNGKEVFYPKAALVKKTSGLFRKEESVSCPLGHPLKV